MPVASGAVATEVNLNDTTPAAPTGALNARWQGGTPYADPNNGLQVADVSVYCPRAGGVAVKAATYTAIATDDGLLLVFNSGSAVTLHLPAAIPTTPVLNLWRVWVANIGLGVLTIDPNGLNIDGVATAITLNQFSGLYITTDGTNYFTDRGAGSGTGGTVTSVALSAPPEFTVSGSPVTTAGTLALAWANEAANKVLAGPASGGAATPTFRSLVVADLPTNAIISVVGITIDGGATVPTTGVKGLIQVPWSATIIGWFAIADQAGSISVDVDKHSSLVPPAAPAIPNTTTDKISASAPVVLSSAQSAAGDAAAVSTWTVAVAQWDSIQFNVTSVATLKRVTIGIVIKRT